MSSSSSDLSRENDFYVKLIKALIECAGFIVNRLLNNIIFDCKGVI